MKNRQYIVIAAVIGLNLGAAAIAQTPDSPPAAPISYAQIRNLHPPVTAGDVTDRPYRVLGEVRASVRKATVFSRAPSQAHVYGELWERAERLHADAVIHASYGDSHITALSWGARSATGQAIKFLTDAEIAAQPQPAPAP
ncbi:MAG: hypothetical protein QOJ53_2263 [Sphingomonadales bacterium]|jgi:hypothetical protein|nr:hypothetical protein [Sphingomonadales bacterium]MEA3047931.1 hypothetical protein [Sphingomonadales bacterium]